MRACFFVSAVLCMPFILFASVAEAQNSWAKFDDPSSEHAFSIDVPRGWRARGGLVRLGYSDVRFMVDLKSPDEKTNIRISDITIGPYALPTPSHREGTVVDLGMQAQPMVAPFQTADQYAPKYAKSRFKDVCRSLTPDPGAASIAVPDYLPVDPITKRTTTGQITYRCDSNSGTNPAPRIAFAYVRTNLADNLWQVRTLVSYLAPPEEAANAKAILLHCVQSFHLNQQWLDYQGRMDQEGLEYQRQRQQQRMRMVQQDVAQAEAKMKALQGQVASFERGQAARQSQFQAWDNIINGVTPTVDPMGNQRDVWTGTHTRYFQNGLGQVVNSDTPPPGGGWQELPVVH